jgi:O-antigen/teichoic acid export membrane protein
MNLFKKGIYWNLFRTLIERAFMFFQQIILAWYLVPEDFGFFSSISSILAICSFFAFFGLNEIIVNRFKFIDLWEPVFNTINYILIFLSFLIYILISIIVNGAAIEILDLILIYGILFFTDGLKTLDQIKLNVWGNYSFMSLARLCHTFILTLVSILLAKLNFGVLSIIISLILASSVEFIILRYKSKSSFNFSKSVRKVRTLLLYSIKLTGFNLSWRLINYLDFILISYFLGDEKAGLYFMAFNLSVQALNIFLSFLPNIIFSSNIRDQLTMSQTNDRIQKTTLFLIISTAPIFFGLFVFSEQVIFYLFNEKWDGTIPLLKILSLAMIPRVLSSQWTLIPLIKSRYSYLSRVSFYYLVLFIFLICFGINTFDLNGGVFAILIFYLSTLLLSKNYLLKSNKYLTETILIIVYSFFSYLVFSNMIFFENDLINMISVILLSLILYGTSIYFTCPKTKKIFHEILRFS